MRLALLRAARWTLREERGLGLEPCGWRALLRAGAVDLVSTDRNRSPPGGAPDLFSGAPHRPENPLGRRVPRAPAAGSKILKNFR